MVLSAKLLATKLYIPRARPALVPRPHLLDRLVQGMQSRLILISALPGSGKTTLLSEWQATDAGKHVPLAWVSLDEADNDPIRFWSYVIHALETLFPAIGEDTLPLLHAFPALPIESVLTTLMNAIATSSPFEDDFDKGNFALVLDDYHIIDASTLHESLTFLLEHMPPQMHVIMLTRTDPPLPLARLRVRGQLTELRTNDLRFTPAESLAFLNQTMRLNLSADDATTLAERTEGWIAGLQLAALSMQDQEDASSLIRNFSSDHRHVVDYLAQEVLERQTQEVQLFLQYTSILQRLSVDLCDAVTEQGNAQSMLNMLEKSNLFLISLDQERHWYRYHALFGDFLLNTLKRTCSSAFLSELHLRAARWYEQQGLQHVAIQHLLSANAFEEAARLIEQTARRLWMHGESRTLQYWLQDLPEELVYSRPRLGLFYAWSLIATGKIEDAKKHMHDVEQILHERTNDTPSSSREKTENFSDMQAELTILYATIARFEGNSPLTIKLSRQAVEQLAPDDLVLRSIAALNLGHAYRLSGDIVAGSEAYRQSITLGREVDNIYIVLLAYNNLVQLQIAAGFLHSANELCQQTLQFAAEYGYRQLPILGQTNIRSGELLYEWNRLEEAIPRLEQGIKLGQQHMPKYVVQGYMAQARVQQALGEKERALEMVSQAATQALKAYPPTLTPQVAALQARLWLAQGNLVSAFRWARECGLGIHDATIFPRKFEYLTLARVVIARGEAKDVLRLLERLRQIAQANGRKGTVIETLLLQSLANYRQDQTEQAFTVLEGALLLAEPEGYIRMFLDEGPMMMQLLAGYLTWKEKQETGIEPPIGGYIRTLLAQDVASASQYEQASYSASSIPQGKRMTTMIEPLGEREKDVLRYLAVGLSNQAIAEEMVIALSTVKSHLKSIYRKLDVESRTHAVARARELHLI